MFLKPLFSSLIRILILVPLCSLAEDSKNPLPNPSDPIAFKKLSLDEVLELQAQFLEGMFSTKKTLESRAELVTTYERILGPTCMPLLPGTLLYEGHSKDPKCNSYIEKTLAIDPENPTAICARDGIDATSCRKAAQTVQIGTFSLDTPFQGSSTLEAKITERRNAPIIDQLKKKLISLTFKRTSLHDEKKEREIKNTHALLLSTACTSHHVQLTEATSSRIAVAVIPSETKNKHRNLLSDDEITFLDKAITRATPTPTPEPHLNKNGLYFYRTRLVPTACSDAIANALGDYKNFPPALCQRYGYYSPQCIDAKRTDKRIKESKNKGVPVKEDAVDEIGRF